MNVTDEEHRHDEDEEESQRKVLLQVRDGIVQQFRLVPADTEIDVRVDACEIIGRFLQFPLQVVHILLALLDDGQGHRPPASSQRTAGLILCHALHAAYILEL